MTEYQAEIGLLAQTDIADIMRYISQTLQEPRTAGNIYREIKQEIRSLCLMPEHYPYEDDERLRMLGIRKLLVKNYKVLYFWTRNGRRFRSPEWSMPDVISRSCWKKPAFKM